MKISWCLTLFSLLLLSHMSPLFIVNGIAMESAQGEKKDSPSGQRPASHLRQDRDSARGGEKGKRPTTSESRSNRQTGTEDARRREAISPKGKNLPKEVPTLDCGLKPC